MLESLDGFDPHDAVDRMLTLLRSAPEDQFSALTVITRELLGMPIAAITIAQGDTMWPRAASGTDVGEMPRDQWVCNEVVTGDRPVTVANCELDRRFAHLGFVTDGGLRFYAGVPLHATDPQTGVRHAIGALCVGDTRPRTLEPAKQEALQALAGLTEAVIATHISAGVAIDVAEIANRQARELARQDRLFRHAERMAMIGSWRLGLPDNDVHWSSGVRRIHELPEDATLPLDAALGFYPPHARAVVSATLERAVAAGGTFDFEVDFVTATGRNRRVRSIGEAETDGDGTVIALTGVFQDVTDRHLLEQQLRRSASTDPMTGIANRAAFDAELERAIGRAVDDDGHCVLVLIDLDHFKAVNDTHGHLAGDDVLRAVAERLRGPRFADAFAARLGGDEFALILRTRADCEDADALVAALAADLAQPAPSDGRMLPMSATLGYAAVAGEIASSRELLHAADEALYTAKRRRRGSAERHGERRRIEE
ncbi:sensor domain-containing diguanylate cyclase [Sphingomonas silueang]|uniref:sensor domain-containing diguanylate cyclase n=1 Tax=Sphingomonas silueang TaxID=3156617 RepID=UPI0032B47C27